MNKIIFKMDRAGYRALMQSPEAVSVVNSYAQNVLAKCPPLGYATNTMVGKNRAIARVYAESDEAVNDNLHHNTLLKARG